MSVNYFVERYIGYDGCNWFLGFYGVDGGKISMEAATTTTLDCASEALTEQEQTYLVALRDVAEYRNEENR